MDSIKQLRDMRVGSFDAGFRRFIDRLLGQGFQIKNVMHINNNRYAIIFGTEKTIMFMYKREPFYNFQRMFRSQGAKGIADTINVDDLKKAHHYKVDEIYSCFGNGIVYKINLHEFLCDSIRWTNKEGKDVRSISLHRYGRAFEL